MVKNMDGNKSLGSKPLGSNSSVLSGSALRDGSDVEKSEGRFGMRSVQKVDTKPKMPKEERLTHSRAVSRGRTSFKELGNRVFTEPVAQIVKLVRNLCNTLLTRMGFPQPSHDFFANWGLVESGMAAPATDRCKQLFDEARELMDSPLDENVSRKVTLYKDGKEVELNLENELYKEAFPKLDTFFDRLFDSPFALLGDKKGVEEFQRTVSALVDENDSQQQGKASSSSSGARVRGGAQVNAKAVYDQDLTRRREEEVTFIRDAQKNTPVYFNGELFSIQERAEKSESELKLKLKRPGGEVVEASVDQLYLPPNHPGATKICNPADVDLASGTKLSSLQEQELLYICSSLKVGDPVTYMGEQYAVSKITQGGCSPEISLTGPGGKKVDSAALHQIQLPQ